MIARVTALVLAAAALVIAPGCGGGDDDEGAGDAAPLTQPADDTSTDTGSDDDGGGGDESGVASPEECEELASLSTELAQAFAGTGDADAIQEHARFFEEFADSTPEEVRDDFQTLAEAYTTLAEALTEADLQAGEQPDPEALQKLGEASESIDEQELQTASQNVQRWAQENC